MISTIPHIPRLESIELKPRPRRKRSKKEIERRYITPKTWGFVPLFGEDP